MHMFDMIVSKNTSALLAGALVIPKKSEHNLIYTVKNEPQFSASNFLKNSRSITNCFDNMMPYKFQNTNL